MITLNKPENRDFIVLNLSDPQMSDGDWAEGGRPLAVLKQTVSTLIDRVKPDLITISGDLSAAVFPESYPKLAQFLDTFSTPWTLAWGNHDNQEGPEFIENTVTRFKEHPLFTYESGDPALGNGNFVICVEENGKPISALIMMDSHDRMPYTAPDGTEHMEWAKLIPAQLDWYRAQVKELKASGCPDSTIIMHIPNFAYREAFAAARCAGVDDQTIDPQNSTGPAYWNPGFEGAFGVNYEGICSYPAEDGVMDAVLAEGHTKHILCGHDHVNNTVIPYRGVKLCYSLKCGTGCYWNPKLNGGTVLTIGTTGVKDIRHEFVDVSALL